MGLTQVMLQVKGCEMVCKQRELIPRLRLLSPPGTELNSYLPLRFASLYSFSFSSSLSPPSSHPCPACQIVSDSTQQGLSGAIKKVPKHRGTCRLLTKMRLDQDQYSLPLLLNAIAHSSTNTITDEPQNHYKAQLSGQPALCHTERKTGVRLKEQLQKFLFIVRQHSAIERPHQEILDKRFGH